MGANYVIKRDTYHYFFNRERKPILHVKPGDRIRAEINDVSTLQLTKKTALEDFKKWAQASIIGLSPRTEEERKQYPQAGPLYVEGAAPGDSLTVDVESVRTLDYGWSALMPNVTDLLRDEVKEYWFRVWDLSNGKYTELKKGVRIPIRPFCGVMAVAPEQFGNVEIESPGIHGGNMDIRYLSEGGKLILPVLVDGALFSLGDMHATQGDGEVSTAIESPGEITFTVGLDKGKKIPSPRFISPDKGRKEEVYIGATGMSPDLFKATQESVRNMILYLVSDYGLTREEAYVLCGIVGDLRIHQVVNAPNWTVGMMIPKSVFDQAD
jgi:acetamidase/formamidase